MSRPIGQKAAKRKNKGKECHNTLDLSSIESVMKNKNMNTSKLNVVRDKFREQTREESSFFFFCMYALYINFNFR